LNGEFTLNARPQRILCFYNLFNFIQPCSCLFLYHFSFLSLWRNIFVNHTNCVIEVKMRVNLMLESKSGNEFLCLILSLGDEKKLKQESNQNCPPQNTLHTLTHTHTQFFCQFMFAFYPPFYYSVPSLRQKWIVDMLREMLLNHLTQDWKQKWKQKLLKNFAKTKGEKINSN
jgi:hypothetical protein